ncbi:MAG: DUF58 domain-containing protein [Gammaproteobacteria bacterium]|nr:DUF58 domain-containing protein [Gammaproteobacteria bacterium]MCW8986894.1 DUF58 domain-containing protein [Gammaproteobacteria bacterium]MCW9030581.1 DUF58 domain-containing protein [Gammaproteobacteria bacterium]
MMFATFKAKFNLQRFFTGEGPKPTPYILTQRRVYILPTRQGLAFALLLFIMLIGSINYSNSLGYFLTFLLASLSVVTIFHTYNNLLKLHIGPAICKPVFASDEACFTVRVNNLDQHNRFSIGAFTPQKLATTTDINENSLSTIIIKHHFEQRGRIPLPRFTIESRFPFGLFRAWAHVQFDQTQLVYPKPSSHTTLPVKSAGLAEGKKQLDSGTDDFKGLRSYAEGDPLQHIHWKSFARHHTLQTKEFSSTTSNELWLNWLDTTVSGIELKLSQLTRWLLLADKANLSYGLRLPNSIIQPNTGKQHLDACLKALALFDHNYHGSHDVTE